MRKILVALSFWLLASCSSVEKTLGALDYACVDVDVNPHTSDSGLMGRGVVIPEGETLTPELLDLICNY